MQRETGHVNHGIDHMLEFERGFDPGGAVCLQGTGFHTFSHGGFDIANINLSTSNLVGSAF